MPLYGRGFLLANAGNNGFYETANQPLPAGPYTREAGIWGNNEAGQCSITPNETIKIVSKERLLRE